MSPASYRVSTWFEPDFEVRSFGSIVILTPITADAFAWVADNLPDNAMRSGDGVVIEPRYVAPILEGIRADDLRVR